MGIFDDYQFDPRSFLPRGLLDNPQMQAAMQAPIGLPPAGAGQPAPLGFPQLPQQQIADAGPTMVKGSLGRDIEVPTFGAPDMAQLPPSAKPVQFQSQPAAPSAPAPQSSPDVGDRLGNAFKGFVGNLHNGPIAALMGGAGSLVTGARTDPSGIAAQKQARGLSATAQGLIGRGASAPDVQSAINASSNGNSEPLNALIKQYYAAPTDEIREFEYNNKNPGFGAYKAEMKRAGATNINNSVNGGGSDKQIFDSMDESSKAARAAATGLAGIQEAKKALGGGIISGSLANERLALQKAGAALGLADTGKIENTETFRAAIAPQVAAMLKSTVGSANISNSDREFAEKAAGGNITLDATSIGRLLDIMEKAGRTIVEDHSKRLEAVYPDQPNYKRERALFGVQMPQITQQTSPALMSKPSAAASPPPRMNSVQEAMKLPPGTRFLDANGVERVR